MIHRQWKYYLFIYWNVWAHSVFQQQRHYSIKIFTFITIWVENSREFLELIVMWTFKHKPCATFILVFILCIAVSRPRNHCGFHICQTGEFLFYVWGVNTGYLCVIIGQCYLAHNFPCWILNLAKPQKRFWNNWKRLNSKTTKVFTSFTEKSKVKTQNLTPNLNTYIYEIAIFDFCSRQLRTKIVLT